MIASYGSCLSSSILALVELSGRHGLGLLVTSQEGMGRGAPLSHGVLEQMLGQRWAHQPRLRHRLSQTEGCRARRSRA